MKFDSDDITLLEYPPVPCAGSRLGRAAHPAQRPPAVQPLAPRPIAVPAGCTRVAEGVLTP